MLNKLPRTGQFFCLYVSAIFFWFFENMCTFVKTNKKDYTTGNFLQWFITEQVEEESTMRTVLDKIKLVGKDKAGMFYTDKDLDAMVQGSTNKGA